ncbi:MAG: glucan biosynthesis protein G [Rhizobiales bacterium]|nr:glucan biosynthesis protein G [Hyphomicrobiales bacterium]MBI3672729.1 glucan biosynthesis protein G [Hyphomicrobiales bacterium]
MNVTRRGLLEGAAKLAAVAVAARGGNLPALAAAPELFETATAFGGDTVQNLARELAAKPFVLEKIAMPKGFDTLTYDQYRDIRFNPEKSFWKDEPHGFSFDVFHSGFLFTSPVDIYVVDGDQQARLRYIPDLFVFGPKAPKPDGKTDLHYSGFRLRYPLNSKDVMDEFAVFQGASYFRAVGKGLLYGLSARGLAIDTGQPSGEEFPFFRSFWIKRPEAAAGVVVVEALLDSPSATGAYRFSIKPGADTQMDVEMTLFPRRDLAHAGIAPLTSMYLFDAMGRPVEDYRNAVHDSDGLMMLTGRGEWLWRPLANHKALQVSAFQDMSPRGFGLMQRKRRYEDFLDLESRYERRPSLWVEPIGDWGPGDVELYEIPTLLETNDNIVAFWHPKDVMKQGEAHSFVYRLHWCEKCPAEQQAQVALVSFSGSGAGPNYAANPPQYDPSFRLYVVEFSGGDLAGDIKADVSASAGKITTFVVYPNDISKRMRLSFEHDATGVDVAELRAVLKRGDATVSETWLYRWTRS